MSEEDDRAKEYRRSIQARMRYRAAQERKLFGTESNRLNNLAQWAPLIPDRNGGWDPYEEIVGDVK